MSSEILRTATKPLSAIILVFAVFLLLRGHDEPGGGFIGGLVAGCAFALHLLSRGIEETRRTVPAPPLVMVAIGLLLALGSGVIVLVRGQNFMTGQWTLAQLPVLGGIPLGTPLLFDTGVFLLVAGMTVGILFTLAEET
jgi:multisubunit Na+/H+ antiporter MnhB subunit